MLIVQWGHLTLHGVDGLWEDIFSCAQWLLSGRWWCTNR